MSFASPIRRHSVAVAVLLGAALSFPAIAQDLRLTRYLDTYEQTRGEPRSQDTFFAAGGPGTVIITDLAADGMPLRAAVVKLNGKTILTPSDLRKGDTVYEVPVQLLSGENELTVVYAGKRGPRFDVRVKEEAGEGVTLNSRVHFNVQTLDYETSEAFYASLGFSNRISFPDTNTLAVAEAIGVDTPTEYDGSEGPEAGGYLLQVKLIALADFAGSFIDLIEFQIPRNEDPPYAEVNHIGMAMAALETANIEADADFLRSIDAEIVSPGVTTRANGERFLVFTDPDGTYYQLLAKPGTEPIEGSDTNINRVGRVTINVTDIERSVAWYTQLLGFEIVDEVSTTESGQVARALGLGSSPISRRGYLLELPTDGSRVELIEWLDPRDTSPPYELPVNHVGINRMAFAVDNVVAARDTLRADGVEFLSPIAPCCSGPDSPSGIVSFLDPDGTVMEFTGGIPAGSDLD